MFENTAKGWHGSYSIAGRNSAEKFHAIVNKDYILKNKIKKSNIHDMFTPDKPKPKINFTETLDVFKNYKNKKKINSDDNLLSIENNKLLKKFKKIPPLIKKFTKKDRFKFHEEHCNNIKKINKKNYHSNDPSAAKYYPKYEYIWPKLISGPTWEFMPGRKENKIIDTREFAHEYVDKNMYKSLVNMKKTTQRGDFTQMKDIRIRTDKPYVENYQEKNVKNHKNDKKMSKKLEINVYNNNNNIDNLDKNYYSHRTINNKLTIENNNISTNKTENNFSKYFTSQNSNKNLKGPDFSKIISRNKYNKLISNKTIIPFILPIYSQVEERSLTMAIYRKPNKIKKYIKNFKGIDPGILFDPDKNIDKINNHFIPKAPNFKLMTCRSSDDKNFNLKLPSYMINLTNRESCNTVTEKTLRINNYPNSKFMSATTSFWPKRSYNTIINLNLLNSDKFIKDTDEANNAKREIIKNSLKKKNYDQLIKEGALNKFDNITYKTNKYENKYNEKEIEKFLVNFDNINLE